MDAPLNVVLDPDPGSSARARRHLGQHFAESVSTGRLSPEALSDVKLVVSELVANAFLHGTGPIALTAFLADDAVVRVEVCDEQGEAPPLVRRIPGPSGGWGLRIVDRLARSWGPTTSPASGVWADVPAGTQ